MPRVRLLFVAVCSLALAAVIFLWAYTLHTPLYIARTTNFRGDTNDRVDGSQAWGLYAAGGAIGPIYHSRTTGYLEPGDPIVPPMPTHWIWDHSDNPDDGVSIDELSYHLINSHLGVWMYDGNEGGLGHMETFHGFLVKTWMVVVPLAILPIITLRQSIRRRKMEGHFCTNCAYDIRTQLGGDASPRCPECGSPITPALLTN